MAEKLTAHEMLATASHLPRLPFEPRELTAIRAASPHLVAKVSARFEPAQGYCPLACDKLHMEFVVVKARQTSFIRRLFGARYVIFMGFDHGDVWEKGPEVASTRAVAYVFQRLLAADQWLDKEYGRKR